MEQAEEKTRLKIARLQAVGLTLSENDLHIVLLSQFIVAIGPVAASKSAVAIFSSQQTSLKGLAGSLLDDERNQSLSYKTQVDAQESQLTFQFTRD